MTCNLPPKAVKKALIGISCCSGKVGVHHFQMVADKYIDAAVNASNAIPVLIPALGDAMQELLPYLDGLYLTGGYSNISPHFYGESAVEDEFAKNTETRDSKRDLTNITLIKKALELGIPVLGVCRGFQEMNVALGGSLEQRLDYDGLINHREDKTKSLDEQYAIAHSVELAKPGLLYHIMNGEQHQQVNSLHGQGIRTLSPLLQSEARSPDGLIEAFSLAGNESFFLGLQWHPEWQVKKHPFYNAIFNAFGEACLSYQQNKNTKVNKDR